MDARLLVITLMCIICCDPSSAEVCSKMVPKVVNYRTKIGSRPCGLWNLGSCSEYRQATRMENTEIKVCCEGSFGRVENGCPLNATSDKACLNGKWTNQLGSQVQFNCKNGNIVGYYMTSVGNANGWYDIVGRYTFNGPNHDTIIASWVVSWNNSYYGNSQSSTTWNGIYYPEEETLHTHWLLVRYQPREDYWQSTYVGTDVFTRTSSDDD
ncbi:hypothetical protein ACF0H5_015204 [Mactra antiquata]